MLVGNFNGNGFLPGVTVASIDVFVMPGPYEGAATADATLQLLAERLG